ncbi:MAG: hypothetical protein IT384_03130 [Deltaproteobacteria bacterium]|nr:hypothetical protein [Deltaproteobacteria bacterium]
MKLEATNSIRWLAGAGLIAGALALSGRAEAQFYVASQYSAPFVPLTGGTAVPVGTSSDDGAAMVPIGFTFPYFGATYTRVNVSVNGLLWMARPCAAGCGFRESCNPATNLCAAASGPYSSTSLPNSGEPSAMIAAFWDDLVLETAAPASQLLYGVQGTAPNRVFVAEWRNIRHLLSGSTYVTFQVRLSEDGVIRLHYGPNSGGTDTSWSGNIGVEDLSQTQALNPATCSGTAGGCAWTHLTALNNTVLEVGLVQGPELIGVVRPPPGADPGARIGVNVRATNIGTQTTTSTFRADVYLSTDETITTADTRLGSLNFATIAAGATRSATLTVNLSAGLAPGNYRIGAILDATNVVPEASKSNNVLVSGPFLVGPDLALRSVTSIATSGPGELLPVTLNVGSLGSPIASAGYAIYLSTDQTLDASDRRIGTGTVAVNRQADVVASVMARVPADIVPGDHYVIGRLDWRNRIAEVDENNNTAVGPSVDVIGPDVVAFEVEGDTFAFRGETYRARATIRNSGGARAENLYYSFHLSDNQLVTISDPLLGEIGPVSLAAGQSITVTHQLPVSSSIAAGLYYLGLIADSTSQILEEQENNNIKRMVAQVTVRDPGPDFTATEIRFPAVGAAGEALPIERVVQNIGNAPGQTEYAIYISADATIDPATDLPMGVGMADLASREDQPGVDQARIPVDVPAGTYYVGYLLDPDGAVAELLEANNAVVADRTITVEAGQLGILTTTLPAATVGLPFQFDLAAHGGTGVYAWSVATGTMPAGLTLDANGRIRGTPERAGSTRLVFAVDDGALVATLATELIVAEPTLELDIITRAIPPAFLGRAYSIPLVAVGGIPPYRWSTTAPLPAGLVLSEGGILSGPGTAVANASITFQVRDAVGASRDRVITVRVVSSDDAVRFTSDVLRDGVVGKAYDDELRVENGVSPFVFELSSGALPTGLMIEACTGQSGSCVQGVPAEVGSYTFAVRVTDSRGDFDLNRFTLTIEEDEGIRFITSSLPPATRGVAYVDTNGAPIKLKAVATGAPGPITYVILAGDPPPGLELTAEGEVRGTPTGTGIFPFTVEAKDALGERAYRALAIVVDEPSEPGPGPGPGDEGGCGCRAARTADPLGAPIGWLACIVVLALLRRRGARSAAVIVALLVGASSTASAQPAIPYFIQQENATYQERSGGTPLAFSSPDDGSASATLPFPFRFFEGSYSTISVGTNGYATFGGVANSLSPQRFPDGDVPNDVIALFWDDLYGPTGSVHVEGNAPSRIVIIQWKNVHSYGNRTGTANFQLWLYEGLAGRFELRYGPSAGLSVGDLAAEVGFENRDGSVGFNLLTCAPACTESDLAGLTNRVIRAAQDGGPELLASSVSGPARIYAGTQFVVESTIQSLHQNPLGPFIYAIHFLPAGVTTPTNRIFNSRATTLAPYQLFPGSDSVTIPITTPPGRYRLALEVDTMNDVAEPDETNNLVFSAADVVVAERRPDLKAYGVTATPGTVAPGGMLTVTATLANAGNLDAPAAGWRVVLSPNAVLSIDDRTVYSSSVTLALLSRSQVSVPVNVPADLTAGRYYVGILIDPTDQVRELDEINNAGVTAQPVAVGVGFLDVVTTDLPGGYVDVPYTAYLRAMGGDGVYRWEVTAGTLPSGLALLSTTGELRGTPRSAARERVTLRVTSGALSATRDFDIAIDERGGSLTIVTRALLPGVVGQPYPAQPQNIASVNVTGTVTYSMLSSAVPGLDFDPRGSFRGVPVQSGVFDVVIEARDEVATATRAIPLTIGELGRLTMVAAVLPDAVLEEEYRFQLQVIGGSGNATITFALPPQDAVPDGLALTTSGLIVGVPQRVGQWSFAVEAMEGNTVNGPRDSANFTLAVVGETGFGITPSSLPVAEVAKAYDATLSARGGNPPFVWRLVFPGSLSLPRGLRFEVLDVEGRQQLHFAGTPEVVPMDGDLETGGAVSFLVTVDDAVGRRAELPVAIRVIEPPSVVVPPDPGGCGCRSTRGTRGASGLAILLALAGIGRFARRSRRVIR